MKYKIGTRVRCFIGSKPTEVLGTIADDSVYQGFVNLKGNSYIKFDKPVKLGEHLITSSTLSNSSIQKI